jgi:tetratricopeptide (TPR) repeat protein
VGSRSEQQHAVAGGYTLEEAGRLLGLSRAVLAGMIAAGFVTPGRGPRREYRFSFQDLVVLRAAQGLSQASMPASRIRRQLKTLRAKLPDRMPLAGLRIAAVGDAVVVSEGARQWRPDTGQYLLQFEVGAPGGRITFDSPASPGQVRGPVATAEAPVQLPRRSAPSGEAGASSSAAFDEAMELETTDPRAALDAYRKVIALDPCHRDAYVNLGRLLHEQGALAEAARVYRQGIERCGPDATLHYNAAVLEEDLGHPEQAIEAYRRALLAAPGLADAHFNLARLFEAAGLQKEALRHWSAYRKLARRP